MIIYLKATQEQKKALLNRYPSINSFLQRTLSETADRLIADSEINNYEKELDEFHKRQALNEGVEWVKGTPFWKNRQHTQATKDKISKSLKEKYKGKHYSLFEETKVLIGKANRGKILSEETKSAIGRGNKGKKRSLEQRQKISQGHTGMKYKKRIKVLEEECTA